MQDFQGPNQQDASAPTASDASPAKPKVREIPRAYLTLTNESVENWCAAISQSQKLIGRNKYCDILIPPKFLSVSRKHAWIWDDGTKIMIRDNYSTAGTWINGVNIGKGKDASLVIGDRVALGTLELRVADDLPIQRMLFAETGVLIDESMESVDPSGFTATASRTVFAKLTNAEFAIVLWIGRGFFKDEELAERLERRPNTIRTQLNSIFRKLEVHSRTDLVNLIRNPRVESVPIDGTAFKTGENKKADT